MLISAQEFQEFGMSLQDLSQLTNGSDGKVNEAVYESVQDMAQGELEGYLAGIYETPIESSDNKFVMSLLVAIMSYRLYVRRGTTVSNWADAAYKNTLTTLKHVREGKLTLPLPLVVSTGNTEVKRLGTMEVSKSGEVRFVRRFSRM